MLTQLQKTTSQCLGIVASTVGIRFGVEEPPHSVKSLGDGVEIRRYGPRIAAQTTVVAGEESARSAGFRRLAGYIFGGNHRSDQIAMTAPVEQQLGERESWVIRFYMPSNWTLRSLPTPDDERVTTVEVGPETVAALRFSGDRGPDSVAEHTRQLREKLRDYGFVVTGEPTAWFYDPPWTLPALRRNEIAIPVEDSPLMQP